MGPTRILAFAGALFSTTAAIAADFPAALPAPPVVRVPAPEVLGWYLRGDVGVGNQSFRSFDYTQTAGGPWPDTWRIDQKDIKDTFFFAAGLGYAWNNWLRFDVTGEYRADVKFKAVGSYENGAGDRAFDLYDGDHAAAVFLLNAYLDLGTWWCITPFIGVGVGAAYHMTSALSDIGINTNGLGASAFGYADSNSSNWAFAWAAHAGVSYAVTSSFKVELAYRYLNMGSAQTAEVLCGASGCGTGSGPRAHYHLKNLDSHDFKLGVRWMLQPEPVYAPPLMRRG
ncbi:MAG: porin family protein [Hyphomicrobiales bacterium]|nr:porin family protein [Hyphomicrobiales bacterium]